MENEWKAVDSIPKDGSIVEVEASPHGVIKAFYDPQDEASARDGKRYIGVWRRAGNKGGPAFPIYPERWR